VSADLALAKREADKARARLAGTLAELQERLKPATLASNAWEGVKDKSGELADDAVQAVKGRPVAVSAALAAFTLFLARAPIKSAIADYFSGDEDEDPTPAPLPEPDRAKPAARRRQRKSEGVSA
jgi:hypothetical protein